MQQKGGDWKYDRWEQFEISWYQKFHVGVCAGEHGYMFIFQGIALAIMGMWSILCI